MAVWIGAGVGAACAFGYINCDTNNLSQVPIEIDQCEETHRQMKEEYGDNYLQTRPITASMLQYIKSINCESTFNYDSLADTFCQSLENYDTQIGGGETCGTSRDPTNSMISRGCLNEEGPT